MTDKSAREAIPLVVVPRRTLPGPGDYWRLARSSGLLRAWSHFWDSHLFDLLNGTDTSHWRPKANYIDPLPNLVHGFHYEASHTSQILRSLRALAKFANLSDYTFYDLGCGKGKALLCAASFRFERLVGIEYDPQLAEIARDNVARMGIIAEVACMDAAAFEAYSTRSLIYLFNPFDDVVLNTILQRVESRALDVILVYTHPLYSNRLSGWERLISLDGPSTHRTTQIFRYRRPNIDGSSSN